MNSKLLILLMFLISFIGCAPKFEECNDLLGPCNSGPNGEFCTFGIKWGENSEFSPNGLEATGPQSSGGIITYSFHTEIKEVSTHQKNNAETISFDSKGDCVREKAQAALAEWEQYGNFTFLQEEDNTPSNVQFIAAKEVANSTGSPNYQDELCSELGGRIVLTDAQINNCDNFYILCLHEIGHVLGLGHVSSENIMNQGQVKYKYNQLQNGDINGIIAIYGEK